VVRGIKQRHVRGKHKPRRYSGPEWVGAMPTGIHRNSYNSRGNGIFLCDESRRRLAAQDLRRRRLDLPLSKIRNASPPRQQPFKTLRRLPADPKQDLGPDLHLAGFHRGEKILLIPISVNPFSPPVRARENSARTLVLTTALLQARSNPGSDGIARKRVKNISKFGALFRRVYHRPRIGRGPLARNNILPNHERADLGSIEPSRKAFNAPTGS
jgi:hypothetical protein